MNEVSLFDVLAFLRRLRGAKVHMHGSAYVCYPPVTTSDLDYCAFIPEIGFPDAVQRMISLFGFKPLGVSAHSAAYSTHDCVTLRRVIGGVQVDVMMTYKAAWYKRHAKATEECKRLNLKNKLDRYAFYKWRVDRKKSLRGFMVIARNKLCPPN